MSKDKNNDVSVDKDNVEDEELTSSKTSNPESDDIATEEGEAPKKAKFSKKKKIILIIIILFVLIGGGIGTFIFLKKHKADTEKAQSEEKKLSENQDIFHDMDEIIVNLNTEGKSVSFMKLSITLNLEGKDNLDVVIKLMPRIRDVFQIYLRELRPTDMQGSVGLYRLREALLLRINKLIYPAQIKDILFKEVLVQ